jgi:cell wall-associated NlpC family hydrolase
MGWGCRVEPTKESSLKPMVVNVAVSTVWTSLESPRELDLPALSNPVNLKEWLASMSTEDRLVLCNHNLVQTQVLYGASVYVVEEQGAWAKVLVPSQSTNKEEIGYPGWMPKVQLSPVFRLANEDRQGMAVVIRPTTYLYKVNGELGLEISFQTRLPVTSRNDQWITVSTPDGPHLLKKEDVAIIESEANVMVGTGEDIVASGKMFLDLPYLWGGMSGFGYDCSGFAYSMHLAHGITIPRDASDQAEEGKAIEREGLEPGDLLFFAKDQGKGWVHHVGIYAGQDRMLHSPSTGKTIEMITLSDSTLEAEYAGARRYW